MATVTAQSGVSVPYLPSFWNVAIGCRRTFNVFYSHGSERKNFRINFLLSVFIKHLIALKGLKKRCLNILVYLTLNTYVESLCLSSFWARIKQFS